MTTIKAILENGVFKPVGDVRLLEHQRVTVLVAGPTEQDGSAKCALPRRSLRDLLGRARTVGLPPNDDECDRLRDTALQESLFEFKKCLTALEGYVQVKCPMIRNLFPGKSHTPPNVLRLQASKQHQSGIAAPQ